MTSIGRSVRRLEDRPLVTGRACFVDDLEVAGAVHMAVLRSPVAHARIASVDIEQARAAPDVVDVVVARDLPNPPIPMRMWARPGMERYLQRPLADSVVRYSGEPVAVVLAKSRYAAEDALEEIAVAYEPLDPVVEAEAALRDGAPPLFADTDGNCAARIVVEHGEVSDAFANADLVIQERLYCQRHAAVPLEPRGVTARLDERTGVLTIWGAAKIVHINRRILARLLDWPEERLRLVELDVGGGFGARGELYSEDYLVAACAVRLRAPVTWTEDREEGLRALNHSREQVHDLALALNADGTFAALRDHVLLDTGAYVRTHGSVVPGMTAAFLAGPYRWPAYRCDIRQVVTNKTPCGTYRSPGRYEANFARERIIDIAAERLGLDPLELRRLNLVQPGEMPYAAGTSTDGHPVVYDSGDYPLLLEKCAERFAYDEMRRWADEPPPGRRRGIGAGYFVEKSGIGRWDWARVTLGSEGRAIVDAGIASVGQGVETVLAQLCAEGLGVEYEDIEAVRHGDTAVIPDGMGAFGSRATMLAGTAVFNAASMLRARILRIAAEELEAAEDDLTIGDGRVTVRGSPARAIALRDVVDAARAEHALGRGRQPGLSEESYFLSEDMSFPYGLHLAAVEIDEDTGAVHVHRYTIAYDVGRAINPTLVEGQIVGGLAQGLGGALLEQLVYSADGQLITGSFMDYLLPTAGEVPRVDVLVTEDAPTPLSPIGAKGAGEGGTAAAGAAIANAVSDATGQQALALPLTPERVRQLARSPRPG